MKIKDKDLEKHRVDVLKALAHPSRLYIVLRLAEGEACVGDLTKEIGADVSTISKHLAILRDAGLVTDRREGQNILYSLACGCILDFIHCIDAVPLPGNAGARRRPGCGVARTAR
ncbi:MAG: metalloregulator ArsR/SmtB family transcription factor [Spirochaetes bacterium]|nr:metalloregulator ArsR/SmtB family transcription factor [Spirochaetota bacterium]